jgi:predicted ATPase/DNA-binding winged helix-turn-helix (wHTH) protein
MTDLLAKTAETVSFGPFSLDAGKRHLTRDGVPVELGTRTLDTLIALVTCPGEAISKKDLMAKVWPDVTVSEASLRFHIANLRKALGDGIDGARYVATLGGRGYCFVAPVSRMSGLGGRHATLDDSLPSAGVPSRLARMVGRADGILAIARELTAARFVTIVGAGGVGKTTVAVAVGHEMVDAFAGAVLFVDFGALSDPSLVAGSVASMLGLSVQAANPAPGLITYLRDKRILLILDNCEHLMEGAAALAGDIFASAPQVHILATSREALRVEGEKIYRLEPLAFPPEDFEFTTATALTFPAVQLFMERAAAGGAHLAATNENAGVVASICRRLDGLALAIELAAGRVGTYGLQQTAALLEERLALLWLGQRTAPPRQQTLKATLDWSYRLLSDLERRVLRHLAVFNGSFTLETARAVLVCETLTEIDVFRAIDSLIAKSMVTPHGFGTSPHHRLLDTTRAYVLEISDDDVERATVAARHADHYRHWLEITGVDWPTLKNAAERSMHLVNLANVRAALEWCFCSTGDIKIGVELAAVAVQVFWAKSLYSEAYSWANRAILALDSSTRGGIEEMRLQATLALLFRFVRGDIEAADKALNRGLTIAIERKDDLCLLQMLVPVHAFRTHTRDFTGALQYAKRCAAAAEKDGDPAAIPFALSLLGISLHFNGDLKEARTSLERGRRRIPSAKRGSAIYLGARYDIAASIALARNLWLQGFSSQAIVRARETVQYCTSMNISHAVLLNWAFSLSLWAGDLHSAKDYLGMIGARAALNSQSRMVAIDAFKGRLAICEGDIEGGVDTLQDCLKTLRVRGFELLTEYQISLVEGLIALDRRKEALALIDQVIPSVQIGGDLCYMPEIFRLKGQLLRSIPQADNNNAKAYLERSLELSRRQGALAWELRSATDLAAHLISQGQAESARTLLKPVFNQFTEDRDTPDLKAAGELLAVLN